MNANETATTGNSMIVGQLRGDFLCLSNRAGLVFRVRMHAPVSQRSRSFDDLFGGGAARPSSAMDEVFGSRSDCADQGSTELRRPGEHRR